MLAKIILLEGCDGSGKTFLANWLHDTYGYQIIKTGPPVPGIDVTVSYLRALRAAIKVPSRTVFDRLHIGEAIYGPILRGEDRMGPEGMAAMERVIAKHNIKLIICSPPWNTLVAGWSSKDDLLKDEATLLTVQERYLEEADRFGIQPYDWTAVDADQVLKGLIEC